MYASVGRRLYFGWLPKLAYNAYSLGELMCHQKKVIFAINIGLKNIYYYYVDLSA
jgi:hypothetical protein